MEGVTLYRGNGSFDHGIQDAKFNVNSGGVIQLEESAVNNSSSKEIKRETVSNTESKLPAVSKKPSEKIPNQVDNSESVKTKVLLSGNEKPSSSKFAVATWLKRNEMTSVSNGAFTLAPQSKQPLVPETTQGLSNDKQSFEGNASVNAGKHVRSISAPMSALQSPQPAKSGEATCTTDVPPPEGSKEQRKNLKPFKQHALDEKEEHADSTLSPIPGNSKPRRLGAIPSYGFSFKCDERAEKRKEFFSKLEEKIHAKEVEKSTLQAQTKESQEAEVKLFRKSLTFRATPMPSFYQEPAPPKVELKKIPSTRAKSPKLGRQKSSLSTDIGRNSNLTCRAARLSADEDLVKNPSLHSKKHHRKSHPRLPSEKTTLTDLTESCPEQQPENHKLGSEGTEPLTQTEAEPLMQEENPTEQESYQ